MMKNLECLELAKHRILDNSVGDPTSHLASTNLRYGLAKILYAQEYLGFDIDAYFIGVPDFTITRSNDRWLSGFSYGGLLIWGNGTVPLMVLDARPNTCGILVGSFSELPSLATLVRRIDKVIEKDTPGDESLWNFTRRNHFFNIYKPKVTSGNNSSPYYFFLHGCPRRVKSDNKKIAGLYIDKSNWLRQNCTRVKTPFGLLRVLLEDKATYYFDCYLQHEAHSKAHRIETARDILGDFELISNETHEGLVNLNQQILGCYLVSRKTSLPLSFSMNEEAYIITPKTTIQDLLRSSRLKDQIKPLVPYDLNKRALIPHGSGYSIPCIENTIKVLNVNGKRYYVIEIAGSQTRLIISSISEIPFSYRNAEGYLSRLRADYVDISKVLEPVYSFKV